MDGFTLIADPTRRTILDRLRVRDADVSDLVAALALSQPLVSKHLRVLREAGAVTVRIVGKRRVYRIGIDPLPDVLAWVTPYHRMWMDSLDRLDTAMASDNQTEDRP